MSFYFDPVTSERAKELGLNVFEYYGLGRGGVLGDVDTAVIESAFTFFHRRTIDFLWEQARAKADPMLTAREYLTSAYSFAHRTFGGVDEGLLRAFGDGARAASSLVEPGRYPLFDGYRAYAEPGDVVSAAFLAAILLRELRGGVHIDAVDEVGLTPTEACYLQDRTIFKLHGYGDEDVPPVTTDLETKKVAAEAITSRRMAQFFSGLDDEACQRMADGALAMFGALSNPVAVRG